MRDMIRTDRPAVQPLFGPGDYWKCRQHVRQPAVPPVVQAPRPTPRQDVNEDALRHIAAAMAR